MKIKSLSSTLALGLNLTLTLLWLLSSNPLTIRAADLTVCPGGGCNYTTIQTAVDAAAAGDVIKVAEGTYTDLHLRDSITQVVYISKTIVIQGGYTTAFTEPPAPIAHPTTVNASGLGRGLVISGPVTVTVEGLRFTGGDATGLGGASGGDDAGGGVYVNEATSIISNCVIYSNTASRAGDGYGGGLYLESSKATLQGNLVQGNTANTSIPGEGKGGGLYLNYSDVTLQGNTVQGNTASTSTPGEGKGGGLYLHGGSNVTLQDNTVQGNVASTGYWGYGGGLHLDGSNAMLQGNRIISNTASTAFWGRGGGLCLDYSVATFENNMVVSNTASTASFGIGGGLLLNSGFHVTLRGNTVQDNTASTASWGMGGGLYLYNSDVTFEGNTVISNTATLSQTAAGRGGGLYVRDSSPLVLTNNLVAGNHANTEGSGLWLGSSSGASTSGCLLHTTIADNAGGQGVYVGDYTTLAFTNTIIAGHSVGITVTANNTAILTATLWHGNGTNTGGGGTIITSTVNVYGDPVFANPAAWEYHLGASSAAIDAGVDAGVTTDIDGDPQPWPPGGGYDIGTDEYTNQPPAANTGSPQTVSPGVSVTLDGSESNDPDGDALIYGWAQTGGISITLSSSAAVSPTFTAPLTPGMLTFTLTVTDPFGLSDTDTTIVTVTNQPPAANTGSPQTVSPGVSVTLDGSESNDPDGDALIYGWAQTGGISITLSSSAAVSPTFTAPLTPGMLTFTLTVTDPFGLSDTDTTIVTVEQYHVYLPLILRNYGP